MENAKQINEQLTICGQINLNQLQQAAQEGFKSVLNLRSSEEKGYLAEEEQQAKALGLVYCQSPVTPTALNQEHITQILQLIDDLPKPVLLHCGTGLRAGVISLMYLVARQEITPEQAWEKAQQLGIDWNASPKLQEIFQNYLAQFSRITQTAQKQE